MSKTIPPVAGQRDEERAREHYAGGGMRRDTSEVWQTAEEHLRAVCKEKQARIEELEAKVADLEVQLGQRARIRTMMSRAV